MGGVLGVNNERLRGRIEIIRTQQLERLRTRAGGMVGAHVLTDERFEWVAEAMREEHILAIWADPAYPEMARRFAEIGAPKNRDNAIVHHALLDLGRLAAGIWALYLHSGGGLTHTRLAALWELSGGGGSRARAHAMIAYMRFLGYIEPDAPAADGRERRYRPTRRMRDSFSQYFGEQLEVVAMIRPEIRRVIDRLHDDAVFDAFMALLGEGMLIVSLIYNVSASADLNVFSGRRSGMVILWEIVLMAGPVEDWPNSAPFAFTVAELARRSNVSRTHVLRALRAAEADDMLDLSREGSLRIRSKLRIEVNTFIALSLICLGACAMGLEADMAAGKL